MMVVALSFTACSSDDDGDAPETSICGTWKCVSVDIDEEWAGFFEEETQVGDILYMNEDHTYKIVGHNNESGTWSLRGNTLTVTSVISVNYTITQLTSSTLSITLKELGVSLSFSRQ